MNKHIRVVGVIPSRFGSTRFPGKPLAVINGKTLIERVWIQSIKSKFLDEVIIATDDKRILACAKSFGAKAVLTPKSCASGTDRIASVALTTEKKADIFINIQGDEPLISSLTIDRIALALMKDRTIPAATAVFRFKDPKELLNPNVVKVVFDEKEFALYFSRCAIPYLRSGNNTGYFKHLGIYGYTREFLLKFARWKETKLEKAEQLEQLRILEKGYRIKIVHSNIDSFGVDVPGDVLKIEKILNLKRTAAAKR